MKQSKLEKNFKQAQAVAGFEPNTFTMQVSALSTEL
jgi:hypothetical protein